LTASQTLSQTPSWRRPGIELFLLSFISLFFELLIIRWLTCDFKSFLVFKNFPLVTCFVGLGVGLSLGDDKNFKDAPWAMLATSLCMLLMIGVGINDALFPSAGLFQWFNFELFSGWQRLLLATEVAAAVLVCLAGPFFFMVCLGSRIGVLFNQQKPLSAYCIDIAGAICGSLCFSISSFFCAQPAMQLIVPALVLLLCLKPQQNSLKTGGLLVAAVAAAFVAMTFNADGEVRWTPYYRLIIDEIKIPQNLISNGHPTSTQLFLFENHGFMQALLDPDVELTPEGEKNPRFKQVVDFSHLRRSYYELPHQLKHNDDVLILGCGAGSDVREALKHGAKWIDGVEIDPETLKLGHKYNEAYNSPIVHLHCDDARSFINKTTKKYDLIFVALLDAMGLVGQSSMRTDSYIHTADSYHKCLSLLKPGGMLVISFGNAAGGKGDWLRDKMYDTIKAAAGYPPIAVLAPNTYGFIAGDIVRSGEIRGMIKKAGLEIADIPADNTERITTDDWPYLYIRPIGIDAPYCSVLLVVIALVLFCGRKLLFAKTNTGSDWQLFFLGTAFILLELQSISRLSLLYGNTWLTSSIVVNGVLVMILAANFLIIKLGMPSKQGLFYAGLLASLLLSYFLPVGAIFAANPEATLLNNSIITFVTLLPMFMAGLVFATAYSRVTTPGRSFAFNLMGSVLGGLLDYMSIYFGINSLILFAVAFYLCSYSCYRVGSAKSSSTAALPPSIPDPSPSPPSSAASE